MIKRAFVQPTSEEIKERKKMYREAASLGIDLMEYDESRQSSIERRDRREAVVLLGTGRTIPEELRERLIKRKTNKEMVGGTSPKKPGEVEGLAGSHPLSGK